MTQGHTRVYDVVQQLAQPEEAILDRFGIDVVDIGRAFNTADSDWYDIDAAPTASRRQYPGLVPSRAAAGRRAGSRSHADGTRIATHARPAATFFDQTCFPYLDGYPADYRDLPAAMGKVLWAALVHSPWDHAGEPDFWDTLRAKALALRAHQRPRADDRRRLQPVRVGHLPAPHRQLPDGPRRRTGAGGAAARRADGAAPGRRWRRSAAAVGDVADIIRFGDDLGTDSGPFMSPDDLPRSSSSRATRSCATTSTGTASMKTFLHSCGSIYELLPDLIEAGLRRHQPGADHLPRHGARAAQARVRQGHHASGAAAATRGTSCNHGTPGRGARTTSATPRRSSRPAAASSSTPSTTSCPTCRRRTSSPCSRRSPSGAARDPAPRHALRLALSLRLPARAPWPNAARRPGLRLLQRRRVPSRRGLGPRAAA